MISVIRGTSSWAKQDQMLFWQHWRDSSTGDMHVMVYSDYVMEQYCNIGDIKDI